jgi:hypothetical protein
MEKPTKIIQLRRSVAIAVVTLIFVLFGLVGLVYLNMQKGFCETINAGRRGVRDTISAIVPPERSPEAFRINEIAKANLPITNCKLSNLGYHIN